MLAPALRQRLEPHLTPEQGPGKGGFFSVSLEGVREAALFFRVPPAEAMARLLESGIWPRRFKANRGLFSAEQQAALLRKRVAVIGCGGLGGHLALLLARAGVGGLTLCDYDRFEESNLNRQLCCREDRIGMLKAEAAAEDVLLAASHVDVRILTEAADAQCLPRILKAADAVADCLDSIPARKTVADACRSSGLPFIHAAIAGLEGMLLVCPAEGKDLFAALYGQGNAAKESSSENIAGVPTPAPAATAALQAYLVLAALLGLPAKGLRHLDIGAPELDVMDMG